MPPPPPTKKTVLDLQVRQRIVGCISENPGLHLRALAERLDMPVSTLEYHCYQLVKTDHLVTRETAGFKAFYPAEGMDRRDKDILYLVRQEAPRRVCAHLLLHPGATPKDLKAATGLSGPTLSFHLKKLLAADLLLEEPAGRTKLLSLSDEERVANVLVTYRKSFLDDTVDAFAATWLDLHAPSRPPKEPKSAERDVVARAIEATEARKQAKVEAEKQNEAAAHTDGKNGQAQTDSKAQIGAIPTSKPALDAPDFEADGAAPVTVSRKGPDSD